MWMEVSYTSRIASYILAPSFQVIFPTTLNAGGARIAAAAGAFACLCARIISEPLVDLQEKSAAYQALILNLLFYGSECWALFSHMLKRPRSFHRRCVRTMCGCSLIMGVVTYSRSGRVTSHADVKKRMHMPDIATLLSRRRLQWAGHVLRMGEERSPRRTLTSWIPTARPKGRPHLTFAQGLVKDLAYAGLNTSNWGVLAADRRAWRTTLNNLGIDGAKLIASACAAAATAVVARGLALSASMIAAADAEVARIVPLEQVEPAKRAAAAAEAAAPTSTAASRQKKGRRGGGSENALSANGYMNAQSALRPSHGGSKLRQPQHEGNHKHSLNIYVCVFVYIYTFMSACTRTHTHACFL